MSAQAVEAVVVPTTVAPAAAPGIPGATGAPVTAQSPGTEVSKAQRRKNKRNRNKKKNNANRARNNPGRPGGRMNYEAFVRMSEHVLSRTKYRPKMAIICGSGLGPLAAGLEDPEVLSYESIPGFPRSTVEGHQGELVFGLLSGVPVVAMKGRFHPYEGYPLWRVVAPIRLFKVMGINTIMVSNAAGGLNPEYKVGDVMLIKDHINMLGFANQSPLTGPNIDEFGARFPPISKAYTRDLLAIAKKTLIECNGGDDSIIRTGVYTSVGGPTYETIAECRLLRQLGSDAVGMSTTQEVIAAAHAGIRCIGVSLITNEAIMDYDIEEEANHEEVLATAKSREPLLTAFAAAFVNAIRDSIQPDPEPEVAPEVSCGEAAEANETIDPATPSTTNVQVE